MSYCDKNVNVIRYSSEEIIIPYVSPKDGAIHRYFPDFFIEMNTKNGLKKFLIEIKPETQTKAPQNKVCKTNKQKLQLFESFMTFQINEAKWAAAEQFCKKQEIQFLILTEKELFNRSRKC